MLPVTGPRKEVTAEIKCRKWSYDIHDYWFFVREIRAKRATHC